MASYISGKKFIYYSIILFLIIFVIIIFVFRSQQLKNIISTSTGSIVGKVFFTQKTEFFLTEFNKGILSNPKFLKMEKYGGNSFDLEVKGMGKQNPFMLPAPIKSIDDEFEKSEENLRDLIITDF